MNLVWVLLHRAFAGLAFCIVAMSAMGQTAPKIPLPNLGLPRIDEDGSSTDIRLRQSDFEVWLPSKAQIGRHLIEPIQPRMAWRHLVRSAKTDELYVSIVMTASAETEINVGLWRFRLAKQSDQPFVALQYSYTDDFEAPWSDTGVVSSLDVFVKRQLASLPVLTFRFSRNSEDVDFFANATPLRTLKKPEGSSAGKSRRGLPTGNFEVVGGVEGVWVSSLVQADVNPLYVDDNANGVDDDFEAAYASVIPSEEFAKQDITEQWRQHRG